MSIFDVFSFKKKFQEVFTPENFAQIRELAKEKIIEQVKEEIAGSEKMDKVVEVVVEYIRTHIYSNNKLVQWVIDNILIPNVRTILQAIYEDLKQKVKGL